MKVLGVTGNIGSGKSAFCSILRELGAVVFDADSIAKQLMVDNLLVREQLIEAFGMNVYLPDGQLNRPWLAEEAFSRGKSAVLNDIVHPAVSIETRVHIDRARRKGAPLFVKEAALLLRSGRDQILDYVVWIQAPLETRISRVVSRDSIHINAVLERNEKQPNLSEVACFVDEIVINDGTFDELKQKAGQVFHKLTI